MDRQEANEVLKRQNEWRRRRRDMIPRRDTAEDIRLAVNAVTARCKWSMCGEDGVFDTGCGNMHLFESGGVEDNLHKFCPYCGGEIELAN